MEGGRKTRFELLTEGDQRRGRGRRNGGRGEINSLPARREREEAPSAAPPGSFQSAQGGDLSVSPSTLSASTSGRLRMLLLPEVEGGLRDGRRFIEVRMEWSLFH